MRDCTGCSACCEGNLIGNAHGNPFGPRPCVFLDGQMCSIYDTRPGVCAKYQCAWSQELFDDTIKKPSESNLLISVENNGTKQFLRSIHIGEVDPVVKEYVDKWAVEHNTYVETIHNENSGNGTSQVRKIDTIDKASQPFGDGDTKR